jgi:hypothetical protein
MTAEVEGEDEICVGDILTCKLRVDYYNLPKGSKSGYVHSKHYPYLKRDNWFLIITDDQFISLAAIEKFSSTENFFEKEFKERIGRPGKISFTGVSINSAKLKLMLLLLQSTERLMNTTNQTSKPLKSKTCLLLL